MAPQPLLGKVALVTGAGRGIGRAVALSLARSGAQLVLAARSADELTTVRREIEALGTTALDLPTDVASEEQVTALLQATHDRFGRLDVVVNNAGIGVFEPLEQTTSDDWDRIMAVNARGTFLVCREALAHLEQQPRSYIVNIASVVGVKGYANQAAYSASKHAVIGMTKALAKEVQADGVRVHAINPGGVATEMVTRARPDIDPAELIQPDEIAELVLFLVTRQGNGVVDQINIRRESSTAWV